MLEFIEKTYTNAVINVIGSISTKKQTNILTTIL